MHSFSERLCALIDALGITRTKFSDSLHVSSAFVSMLCSGKSLPSDRTISDICRTYNASEDWLRTGDGDMFQKLTRDQELAEFFGKVVADPDDAPRKRFISIISKLSAEEWKLLDEIAKKMAEDG